MKGAVEAIRVYLQAEFPGHDVQVLERDQDRRTLIFAVGDDGASHVLRVADEVLDLDSSGVSRLLRELRVGWALRRAEAGEAVLVTTDGIRTGSISD